MNIAVFSSSGHDSGVTILKDGEIYEVVLEERLSREKRDPVLYHVFEPVKKFHELHGLDQIFLINSSDEHYKRVIIGLQKHQLQYIPLTVEPLEHHLYHASSGFYASGFDEAVCIIIDCFGANYKLNHLIDLGVKEFEINSNIDLEFVETTTIYEAQYPNKFDVLWKNFLIEPSDDMIGHYPDNFFEILNDCKKISVNSAYDIGIMYEAVSYHLGFGQENCGKAMGLSAYGKYNEELPRLVMNNGMSNMNVFYSSEFLNITNHPELRTCKTSTCEGADLAWAVQKAMEYILVLRVKQVLKLKPNTKNIVFTGGCAMNICANTVMCEEFPNINFFIDPIAGDAGQSLGAAQYFHYDETQSMKKHPSTSVYYGQRQEITKSQIEYEVAKINNVNYN